MYFQLLSRILNNFVPSKKETVDNFFTFFQMAKVASYLKKVRLEIVPHLVNFSREAMDNSTPIIRPLWMLDPHDPINQVIDDEFLIGDKVNNLMSVRLWNFKDGGS